MAWKSLKSWKLWRSWRSWRCFSPTESSVAMVNRLINEFHSK